MTAPQLYALMLRMTHRNAICEDLLQEVFVSIWRNADKYHPDKARVMTWLITITRNRTLDWLRTQGTGLEPRTVDDAPESLDLENPEAGPARSAERAATGQALDDCMETLSDDQRHAISLAYLEGYSHGELSKRLSTPLGTVKSWVRRGLDRLKQCLKGAELTP